MPLHYINGQFTGSSGTAMIEVHDPATEEVLDTVPRGTAHDAAAALEAAHAAFPTWRRTSANVRAHLLHEAAAHMRQHKEQLMRLLTLEEGKPLPENRVRSGSGRAAGHTPRRAGDGLHGESGHGAAPCLIGRAGDEEAAPGVGR